MDTGKEPGPGLWLSLAILTIGATAATVGAYFAFQSAFEVLSIDSFETPGEQTRSLDPGEYEIYVRTASVSLLDLDIEFEDFIGEISQVTVTDASTGELVQIEPFRTVEPLTRSANVYEAVAVFEVESPGRYTVRVDSEEPSRAVFARSIDTALDRAGPWLVVLGIGVLFSIIGSIMLIVGMVRRKRHRDRQPEFPAPPTAPSTTDAAAHIAQTPRSQPPAPLPTETETPWGD